MAKDITLEDLAGMVNRGFEGVNERIDKVETRLGSVENQLGEVETRLSTVEQDVKDIKSHIYTETYKFEIKDLDNRVTKLEKKLA